MGVRLSGAVEPEITENSIRSGWDYQYEHEHGLDPAVRPDQARWHDLKGMRVLVMGASSWIDPEMLQRIWEKGGPSAEWLDKSEARVWALWGTAVVSLWFTDKELAATVEQAILTKHPVASYAPRQRTDTNGEVTSYGGNEFMLVW